jgi:O-antigen/teichoic acid export membrane protein
MSNDRLDPSVEDMRSHTARGTLINAAFMVGLAALGLLRRVAVAGFLTREEFGLWGMMLATLVTLVWLKQVGIADKYIQQDEPDQEAAFQKAFTLELGVSTGYFFVCALAVPAFALAYGQTEIILPGIVLASAVFLTAFQMPTLIPYRRMQYARQRVLASVDPVVSIVATIGLVAAGYGIWGLVAGAVIGSLAGAVVCVATSAYRLRLRFDRATLREYVTFSWPLLAVGISGLVTVQGMLLVANGSVGLAGVGAIGLATSIAAFSNRVDGIVSQTIYPAVCAVSERVETLAEVFEKSNRIALMWALPFAAALALFAGDLVHFLLGDQWEPAIGLLAAVGICCGIGQVAFNWGVFMRALNRTKPLFIAALLDVVVFALVTVPAILLWGLTGFAVSFAVSTVVQIAARTYFMREVFGRFDVFRQLWRAIAPVVPASAIVLAVRMLPMGDRSLAHALAELALFTVAAVAFTYVFERRLVRELSGYVRGRVARAPSPNAAPGV